MDSQKSSNSLVDTETVDEPEVYCVCRSSDVSRFMIGCEKCNEWFHGDCVNVTADEAQNIKHWYCEACRVKDPSLRIKYSRHESVEDYIRHKHQHHSSRSHSHKTDKFDRKKSSRMCGNCVGCTRTDDCGRCDYCKDMKKYGGPNRLRQKCRLRQCVNKGLSTSTFSSYDCSPPHNGDDPISFSIVPERAAAAAARKAASEKKCPVPLKHKHKVSSKSSKEEKRARLRSTTNISERYTRSAAAAAEPLYDAVPRQCLGPGCVEAARTGSKYCSDECGLKLAQSRIFEILPSRIKQWHASPCVADEKNRSQLERIRGLQLLAREKLLSLERKHRELNVLIDRAKRATILPEPENSETDDEAELNIFCVTCGMEISQRGALRHMEKCFNRFESQASFGSIYKTRIEGESMFCDYFNSQQGTYCKRLKVLCPEHLKEPKVSENEVCGCPLVSDVFKPSGEFCRIAKRKCSRHHAWEKLRRAEIDMERMRQWLLLDELFEQERNIRLSMANRSGVLALLLHQTIEHS